MGGTCRAYLAPTGEAMKAATLPSLSAPTITLIESRTCP